MCACTQQITRPCSTAYRYSNFMKKLLCSLYHSNKKTRYECAIFETVCFHSKEGNCYTFIQLWTCSTENVWRATVRYGAISHSSYCTAHVYTCFTSKHVFLAYTEETHKTFTLLHMSGLAIGLIHYTGKHQLSGAAFSLTHDNTGNRLACDLSLYSVNNI